MPALIGGALYLVSVEYLCRVLFRDRLAYVLTFSALTTSPFILDYLVAARGYGLALGFFMIAVLRCALVLLEHEDAGGRDISTRTCCQLSCLCALSVASNLSFAFVNVALLYVFLLLYLSRCFHYVEGKLEWHVPFTEASQTLFSLTIPGALTFIAASPNIIHFGRGALYTGLKTWRDVYRSLADALFDDLPAKSTGMFWSELFHWIAVALPLMLGVFIVVGGLSVATKMRRSIIERSQLDGPSKFWLFLFAVVLATIALHSVALLIKGMLLPIERTGLFFVPLGILLAAMSIHNVGDAFGRKILKTAGWFCFPLLIGCFLYSFHARYFRAWKYDAGAKDVFLVLNSLERDSVHSGVGVWPFFAASLDFYRSTTMRKKGSRNLQWKSRLRKNRFLCYCRLETSTASCGNIILRLFINTRFLTQSWPFDASVTVSSIRPVPQDLSVRPTTAGRLRSPTAPRRHRPVRPRWVVAGR